MSTNKILCPVGLEHVRRVEFMNETTHEKNVRFECPCGYVGPGFRYEEPARLAWDRICSRQYAVPSVGAAMPPAAAAVPYSGHAAALGVISSVIEAALTEGVPFTSLQVQIVGVGAFAVRVERLPDVGMQQLPPPGVAS